MSGSAQNKKWNVASNVITMILCFAGLLVTVVDLITTKGSAGTFWMDTVAILVYLSIIFYDVVGYAVPHGNAFRYTMLVYAVLTGVGFTMDGLMPDWTRPLVILAAVLAAYMSGRLHKKKPCIAVIVLVGAMLIAAAVGSIADAGAFGLTQVIALNQPVIWACFAIAYLSRYEEHKEAGK